MNYAQLKSLYRVSEIGIHYKYKVPYKDRVHINSPSVAYDVLRLAWDQNKIELLEQFKILLLDNRSNCLGLVDIASGSINSCIVDTRLLFSAALKAKASGIILAHNHPSGSLTPSENDKKLTEKICEGGKILDIAIFDHLIVSPQSYYSFADNGLMPK
ncbi:RadC family protein [Emticicia sp. BO119]|uniref:JAB domain-containing protein n=1 Tax=Emticicia sp. BO119 TaxID=2757768 RepID=UPI0015F0FB3E|nr:JAB domain-containing protein [Emticicia sp. BO119]MBA4853450.1 JAB domain-containing protein [Emticicia sp. BO119]